MGVEGWGEEGRRGEETGPEEATMRSWSRVRVAKCQMLVTSFFVLVTGCSGGRGGRAMLLDLWDRGSLPHPARLSLSCPWDMRLGPLVTDSWQVTGGRMAPWAQPGSAGQRGAGGRGRGLLGGGHPLLCRQNGPRFWVPAAAEQ